MKKEFRTKNLLSPWALNPRFVEIHGCVLLGGGSSGLMPKAKPHSAEERQKTEYLLNRRNIWELFEVPPPEPSPRLLCEAGNTVRDGWKAQLKLQFPDRKFVVYFEYAPPISEVTFFQALDWPIEAEDQARATGNSYRADWRPRLVRSPLIPLAKKSE